MLAILVLPLLLIQGSLSDLVVQLQDGKVNGTTIDTPSGQTFYAWKKIPYAKPPIGELRFLAPVKVEPWEDVLDASKDAPACISFVTYSTDPLPINGKSEDCLYVNVYSPIAAGSDSSVNADLTVLVWIYGGGFMGGFSDFGFYDPTPFLEENVIVVTFNYRLGVLGFLSTEDDVIRGNAALKDQVLALKWTRDNIAAFGGNPLDVTIFGESAGAMSVGYHIVSPLSRHLFKGAILESGSALVSIAGSDAREFAVSLASQIDSSITNTSSSEEVKDVLQAADVDVIVNLTSGVMHGPVIETEDDSAFLTGPLYEALEAGDIAQVPIIIGFNSEESLVFTAAVLATQYDTNRELLVPTMPLKENVDKKAVGEEIHRLYVGEDGLFAENVGTYFEWFSDNLFIRSSHKHAVLQSNFAPVYMYQFSYYGTLSKKNPIYPGAGKVAHAQEVGYLFNVSSLPIVTDQDYLARRRLVKLWTNFAKTGDPTPDDNSAELLQNVKWEPISEDNDKYLDIDDDLLMKPSRKSKETAFWDYLWETYSFHPYNTF